MKQTEQKNNQFSKAIITELLLSYIDFSDYYEKISEDEYNEYCITPDDKKSFCEEAAEKILNHEYKSLEEIEEKANLLAEDLFYLEQEIIGDALSEIN